MDKARLYALVLMCAVGTSGCNTTASHELAVAIQNYDARSQEAIAALQLIQAKVVEQRPVSDAERERKFISDALDPDFVVTPDSVEELIRANAPPAPPSSPSLLELRCDHRRFTAAFAQLESAGIFGKRAVAVRAPAVLDALVAQQLAMARNVQRPQFVRLLERRNAWGVDLDAVVRGDGTRAEKEKAVAALRSQAIAIAEEETQLQAAALADLLKAAATGIALREQLVSYGQWSLSDLTNSVAGLTDFITKVSGSDLGTLSDRIAEVEASIADDPALRALVEDAVASLPVPDADGVLAVGGGEAQWGTGANRAGATPCLDSAPLEVSEPAPANPPQPAVPPAGETPPATAPETNPPPQARSATGGATMGV